ncbi:uncharacterized protein [Littorina saxatilis]|uniref:Uncharacterized protein n=1 Tax=Littorina saxatilis TaxID=31220 RepID=A0AAN9BG99_9CAEN
MAWKVFVASCLSSALMLCVNSSMEQSTPYPTRTLKDSLLDVILRLRWKTVTVISATTSEDEPVIDSLLGEIYTHSIHVITINQNEAAYPDAKSTANTETGTLNRTRYVRSRVNPNSTEAISEGIRNTADDNVREDTSYSVTIVIKTSADEIMNQTEAQNTTTQAVPHHTDSLKGDVTQPDTRADDSLLQAAVNSSNNFLVLGSFAFVRQIFQKVCLIVRSSGQEYKLFDTEWLTVVPEENVAEFHREVSPYEHVMALVSHSSTPTEVWTLQRAGDTTQMSFLTSLGPSTPPLSRHRLLPNLSQGLSGRTLKVVVKQRSYYIRKVGGTYEGALIDLLWELSRRLNFTYTLQEPLDDSWGQVLANGQWDGAIGMLIRQEVDFAVGAFSETAERSSVADATAAFLYDHARLLFRQSPPFPNTWTIFLQPFHYLVYLAILLSLCVVLLILLAVQFCGREGESGRCKGWKSFVRKEEDGSCTGWKSCGREGGRWKGWKLCGRTWCGDEEDIEGQGGSRDVVKHSISGGTEWELWRKARPRSDEDKISRLPPSERNRHTNGAELFRLKKQHAERSTASAKELGANGDGLKTDMERGEEGKEEEEKLRNSGGSGVRMKSVTEWVLDDLETLLAGLINRPQEYSGTSDAGRVLVCSWLLLSVVLAAFYSSKLTATLTVQREEPPFTSMAGLLAQSTYTWGIASGTAKSSIISESSHVDHQKFYQGLLTFGANDDRVTSPDLEVQKQKVLTENYAFFTGSSDLYDAWHAESCDVSMISEPYFKTSKVFYLQKGSPYTRIISNEISRIFETGLMTHWKQQWSPDNPRCGDVSDDIIGSGGTVTGLRDMQSAFVLLAFGIGVAGIALGLECVCCFVRRRTRR